jgi:protein TonB
VIVQMLIGKDGSVLEAKIQRSQPEGFFDEAVMDVVRGWRFKPATYQGRPVDLRVDQTIRFDLG